MPSPFPGMDPWLEDTAVWTGFHNSFLVYLRDMLRPKIAPRFIASVEDRVWVQSAFADRHVKPDLWIREQRQPNAKRGGTAVADRVHRPVVVRLGAEECRETYLEILDRETGMSVVTCIELLSPTNKLPGPGRDSYLRKQSETLASTTHLVEIDLLRGGQPTVAFHREAGIVRCTGLIAVNLAGSPRDTIFFYPFVLREALPTILIPLLGADSGVEIDLQALFSQTYDAGDYPERIRYDRSCDPPLSAEDAAWAKELLTKAGLPLTPPGSATAPAG